MTAENVQPRPAYQPPTSSVALGVPENQDTFQRIGYGMLVFFLFLIYSRIFDVKFWWLHIPGIALRIMLAMVVLSRAFLKALRTNIGRAFLFFTVWMVVDIPFSMWRSGSFEHVRDIWGISFVTFLSVAGLISNFRQVRKATYTVAWALLVLTLIAEFWGSTDTGRLFLPQGKFSNPNEMAQALLLGLPLWWMVFMDTTSVVKKAFSAAVMFFMLVMTSKCGSRGALIAFGVTMLWLFLRTPIAGKFKLIVVGVLAMGMILVMMPGKLLRRYTTFMEDVDENGSMVVDAADYDMATSALSSAETRKYLLRASIKYTLQHPLFGVGPGMFPVAEDADAQSQGRRFGRWQGTHNSYTQVSSEMGIPGLIAYLAVIAFALKSTASVYRKTRDDPRLKYMANCAVCLNYCLIVYSVSVFFDYIAYSMMLPVFAGLAAALGVVAPAEIERLTTAPAVQASVPFEQFRPNWRPTAGAPAQA
jgi:O-antigen ligase